MAVIPIQLSTSDLLKGVEQLDFSDLEEFVQAVQQIREKRLADNLNQTEAALLEEVRVGLSFEEQAALQQLAEKSQLGTLTSEELQTYRTLAKQLEIFNAKRIQALGKLAQLRKVSLEEVMKQVEAL